MKLRYLSVGVAVFAGCAPKTEAPTVVVAPQDAVYTATEFAFTGPDTLKPGMTAFRLVNKGAQEHHMILAKVEDGKTLPDVMAAFQANPNGEPSWIKLVGAAGGVGANDSTGSTVELQPGLYVAICFMPDMADMKAHVEKGMVKPIVVAGEANTATAPTADAEIKLIDFGFETPPLTAGVHTIHLVNAGTQAHEAQLIKLDDGKTAQDYLAAMGPGAKGPPPGKPWGGSGALSPGLANYWTANFTPGTYAFICMVPDSTGMAHMFKGMVKEFTVAASH